MFKFWSAHIVKFYLFTFTFTFMHLADAFIQSDLHCIQVTVFTFLSALAFPGNRTHDVGVASAMLYHLSYRKAYIHLHLHLVIWQMLLSKATYNWGVHKAIHLEEAIRQRRCS